jgi:hypothetical protein
MVTVIGEGEARFARAYFAPAGYSGGDTDGDHVVARIGHGTVLWNRNESLGRQAPAVCSANSVRPSAYEGGQVQLFGTQAAIDASGFDGMAASRPLSVLRRVLRRMVEGFAHALRSSRLSSLAGCGSTSCGTRRTMAESTLGGGLKAPGADVEQVLHAAVVLHHDRQPPPVAATRLGGHALDHFLLQHEVHVADQAGVAE